MVTGQCLKILLIEDNQADAELLEEFLQDGTGSIWQIGHVVRLGDGIEHLRCSGEFDAILLDLHLPDCNGLDSLVQIKEQAPDIPILVLTGLNDRTLAVEAVRLGAQDYLVKGRFEGELLIRAIRYAIERHCIERQLRQQMAQERLLVEMLEHIRESLDIDNILQTTVTEVRQFLNTDRVLLYRYESLQQRGIVVESLDEAHHPWHPQVYQDLVLLCLLLREPKLIPTVVNIMAPPVAGYMDFLQKCQLRSLLTLPIWQTARYLVPGRRNRVSGSESSSGYEISGFRNPVASGQITLDKGQTDKKLWGILIAHNCDEPRQWQPGEIDFLKHLASQVAIAIQQSELYQQLAAANQRLRALTILDGLTGIANRRRFDEVLQTEWQRLGREKIPISLILCDIDYFKLYNDTYGHLAGDTCLQQVAQAIASCARRPADLVARYGGEEFAAILPDTDARGADIVAERIRQQVAALKLIHDKSLVSPYVTLSMGIATTIPPTPLPCPTTLINAADTALYQAKDTGRDRVCICPYNPHISARSIPEIFS
ncbi:diguanylate cyclase domain-containing protein [[Phormidium] sp. ETS-05]|uniref:diguanylate cyclase domain-containing protein n=1 Tax=[Phormidium] sp. ETS-05 TaxID=222819 RepID=UPI0018EF0E8D|nr:diguanylate cyclase [[Phormidium] sp. ETS-05]